MIEQVKQKTNEVEQLIIERPIKFFKPESVAFIDNDVLRVYSAREWTDIVHYEKYKLEDLLKSGFKVISITKAFIPENITNEYFGIETAILEREIEHNEYRS